MKSKKNRKQKQHMFWDNLLFTCVILVVYLIGRCIPLYGIDVAAYRELTLDAETLLMQTIGGDTYQYSIFALGISPYLISTIFVQVVIALIRSDKKTKISRLKIQRISLEMTVLFAIAQALLRLPNLHFLEKGETLYIVQAIVVMEMLTGVMMILWLAQQNKKYGIGGQTTLIFVNILDGMIRLLRENSMEAIKIPLVISLVIMLVVLVMENTEKRIPVMRISIHNIYSDKNYLAFKLNPIGVMPVMFSTAFFTVPQIVINGFNYYFPGHAKVEWMIENLKLSKPFGIVVYIFILYCLTIGFARVFVNPKDIAEQLLKNGDCLVNIRAGKETRKYLSGELNRISFISSTIMAICLSVPLFLQLEGSVASTLMMLPSSFMMLTGIWCNLYQEAASIRKMDAYESFI